MNESTLNIDKGSTCSISSARKCTRIPSASNARKSQIKCTELRKTLSVTPKDAPIINSTGPVPRNRQQNRPMITPRNVVRQNTNVIRKRSRSNIEISRKDPNTQQQQRPRTVTSATKPKYIPVPKKTSKLLSSSSINISESGPALVTRNSQMKIPKLNRAETVKKNNEKQTLEMQLSVRKKNYNIEKKKLQEAQCDLINLHSVITELQNKLNQLTGRNDRHIELIKLIEYEKSPRGAEYNKENNEPVTVSHQQEIVSKICDNFKMDLNQLHETGFKLCQNFLDINHELIQDLGNQVYVSYINIFLVTKNHHAFIF